MGVREKLSPVPCVPQPDWEQQLHHLLGMPWPCPVAAEFWDLWAEVMRTLEAHGITPGPESFRDWNDGDAGLVRSIWCLIRHDHAATVVETGVAHGVTSRFILEALERNGGGHLWSIDLPPVERTWQGHVGIAVDDRVRQRWTYVKGTSRRRLPRLLRELDHIDLFVHDSLHTTRNVRFELDEAWAGLPQGRAAVVDDIDANSGFHEFTQRTPQAKTFVCEAEPIRPDFRRANNKGMFGIAVRVSGN